MYVYLYIYMCVYIYIYIYVYATLLMYPRFVLESCAKAHANRLCYVRVRICED